MGHVRKPVANKCGIFETGRVQLRTNATSSKQDASSCEQIGFARKVKVLCPRYQWLTHPKTQAMHLSLCTKGQRLASTPRRETDCTESLFQEEFELCLQFVLYFDCTPSQLDRFDQETALFEPVFACGAISSIGETRE